jgi:hypothetical protein
LRSDLNTPKIKINTSSLLTIFGDIINLVEHVNARHAHLLKHQLSIVNTVESHLPPHIFNGDSLIWFHLSIPDGNDERINTLVLTFDYSLCEYNSVVSMACPVSNPVLL